MSFVNPGSSLGPGAYEEKRNFGQGVIKTLKFKAKKRPKLKISNVGPGFYKPENADALTKVKSSFALFSKTLPRPAPPAEDLNSIPGPGDYDSGRYFNNDNKPFTIGERRGVTFEDNPGVGKYEPDQADSVTKSRIPGAKFSNSPRKTSLGKPVDE